MVSRARKPVSKKPAPKTSAKLKKFATGKSQVMGSLSIDIRKPRVLNIEARFYEDIADAMFEGDKSAIDASDFEYDRIDVPGALAIPAGIRFAMNRSEEPTSEPQYQI